ncbi:MAG: response regulator [Gemmatimonadaceae bacterium]|nr:response regulator [Gemmatimonadaceae bacterium]
MPSADLHTARRTLLDRSPVRRALVIDDEGAVRSVLRRWLKRRGWEVAEAPDGQVALAQLRDGGEPAKARDFDLIICDLRMPSLSGPELHAWARCHRPDLAQRLVFASGDVQEPEAAEFLQQCGCPVLEKPFELSRLEAVLSTFDPRV